MSLMARLVTVSGADLVSSNVSSTADDYSATEPYVTDEEVAYGDRVYVALAGTTFTVAQSSIQTATPGDAIYHAGQLEIGDAVAFTSSNTLPTGISANTLYYVKESDTPGLPFSTWFSVSTTQGGNSVNITATGTGTLTVHRNPVFGVTPGTDDTKWLNSRPTNEWAMFDNFTLTKTSNASSINVTVTPGSRFDVIGLLGLSGASVAYISAYTSGGSGNLLTRTEEFDNAVWNKGTGGSISANSVTAPNGQATADAYTWPSSTGSFAFLSQSISGNFSTAHTFSIWMKRASGAGSRTMKMVVSDLTMATTASDLITVTESWQRFEFTATLNNTGSMGVGLSTGGGTIAAGEVVHVWGAQLNAGSAATDYNHVTGTSQVTYHHLQSYDLTETAFSDDWYAGTYAEAVYKDRLAVSTIDPLASATAIVTLTGSGTVECGSCLFGLSKDIGLAQYGAQVGLDNWSRLERDDFGGIQIDATRGYSDNAEYEAWFEKAKAGALRKLFADYKDTPALYLMAPDDAQPGGWDAIGIHHAIASFRTTLSYPSHYVCRLDFEGLT